MKKIFFIIFCLILLINIVSHQALCGDKTYMTIGTGAITNLYYLTGGAISLIVNKKSDEIDLRLSVESTSGSVYNIENVTSGKLELAIVQSDRLYQAYNGTDNWKDNTQKKLRAVFSIHPEVITLVASEDSGITNINSLRNKRINIGHPYSGHRQNAIHALENSNINWQDEIKLFELEDYKIPDMIQANQLDAAFFNAGHPINFFNAISSGIKKVKFIPISNIEKMLTKFPYYIQTSIPANLYPAFSGEKTIPSFGVKSVLITSEDIHEKYIYMITKEIFKQIKQLKNYHLAYSDLTPKLMSQGLTEPVHSGAL